MNRNRRSSGETSTIAAEDIDFHVGQSGSHYHSNSSTTRDVYDHRHTDTMGHHLQHQLPLTASPPSLRDRHGGSSGNDNGSSHAVCVSNGLTRVQLNTLTKLEKLLDAERPSWTSTDLIQLEDALKLWDNMTFATNAAISFVDTLEQTLLRMGEMKSVYHERERSMFRQIEQLQCQLSHGSYNGSYNGSNNGTYNSPPNHNNNTKGWGSPDHRYRSPIHHPPRPMKRTTSTSLFSDSNTHTSVDNVENSPSFSGPKNSHGTVMMDLNIIYYLCAVDKDATAQELIKAQS